MKILYPVFLKISSKMTDNFWRYIYEDLAYGKTPFGLYIQDNYLCCYIKSKEFSFKITDSTEESLDELHLLLKKRAGILSDKDKIENKDTLLNENIQQTKTIQKKSYRENLIQNYIISQGRKYTISMENLKKILMFLQNAFLFKVLSLSDLDIKEDKIHSIKGIVFKKNKIIIEHDLFSNIHSFHVSEDEIKKTNIIDLFSNFILEY